MRERDDDRTMQPKDGIVQFRWLGGTVTWNSGASVWIYGLCLLLGLPLTFVFLFYAPYRWVQARNWTETSCVILVSTYRPTADNKQRYAPHVEYEYEFAAETHRSQGLNLLPFFQVRGSRREAAEDELQARYPPGERAVCYVNPLNPRESLLDRDLRPGEFFYLPFGLLLVGIGLRGLWERWRTSLKGTRLNQ